MKERPILFSGPMVRAILDGRKTMTRRVMKPQPQVYYSPTEPEVQRMKWRGVKYRPASCAPCPHGQPGDRLWVRETFFCDTDQDQSRCIYRADEVSAVIAEPHCWKPSIFMPRWASRITLEIINVRVERVQDISEEDAWQEGTAGTMDYPSLYIEAFRRCWDSLNAKRGYGWDTNPWVWVISFRAVDL